MGKRWSPPPLPWANEVFAKRHYASSREMTVEIRANFLYNSMEMTWGEAKRPGARRDSWQVSPVSIYRTRTGPSLLSFGAVPWFYIFLRIWAGPKLFFFRFELGQDFILPRGLLWPKFSESGSRGSPLNKS